MARLVGLVLLVLGIFLGVSLYTKGAQETLSRAVGDDDALEETAAFADPEDGAEEAEAPPRQAGRAAPSAITSRVRERVSGAIADGARRHGGE
jgi:hypothetical protein